MPMSKLTIGEKLARRNNDPKGSGVVKAVFLGDSVTHGCFEIYPTPGGGIETVYDPEAVYHSLLRKKLLAIFPRAPLNVINAGISGDNAPGGLKRLERDVLSVSPDLVVVSFGLNDACQGMDKLENYTGALREIFERTKAAGAEVVLLTPNMMCRYADPRLTDPTCYKVAQDVSEVQNQGQLDRYMAAAIATAEDCGVTVCDCYGRWKALDRLGLDTTGLLSNHINHPTRAMHELFADELFRLIVFGE